jgi:UDP-N-acetylmuramate: L-alanyl-gamma-D-glutamyl-meso-diaminopimelate ligase|tara:strand:+ start:5388 stop:6707 length:1320 start_codon:yes stop_codon:yes gene_type:complete
MRIHLIAIGGSAMHNLALALHYKGYNVTGSDDQIFEPSKSRLEKEQLLPKKMGWNKNIITQEIDAVILGMHAKDDNPELLRAKELNLNIYSYPEYIYEQSKRKKRIVIGGSHGKTSITAMILHVLQNLNVDCDYMVGAQLKGFDVMVKLTEKAPIIILEGDEYLSSAIDRRSKFHLYKPHIGVLSGISWDHINVFPTFENYIDQFRIFKNMITESLIYCEEDKELQKLAKEESKCKMIGYKTPTHKINNGITYIKNKPLKIFGNHNLQNLNASRLVCNELGVTAKEFYQEIQSFIGASNRLEMIKKTENSAIYKDFAHSPSKLKATIKAMKSQFKNRELIACMELHTFSSLNANFLEQYNGCMEEADIAIVYFSKEAIKHKRLTPISENQVKASFRKENLIVFTDSNKLTKHLQSINLENRNLLMMSSGNFNKLDYNEI